MKLDGLSSLKYKVIKRDYRLLYNNITVLIGPSLLSPRNSVIKVSDLTYYKCRFRTDDKILLVFSRLKSALSEGR